ncbi:alpha-sarcoglycan [Turdus rufiventris]|nr:alpha-sarcoglycan [Turdus rufiventris]
MGTLPCPQRALALGVALVALAAVPEHRVLPELRVPAETGAIFVHELEREPFLEAFAGSEDDDGEDGDAPVTFRAHLWERPDLPRWLRFIQRDPGQPGYLYGSPLAPELGTHSVQVLAYNRHTFATVSQRLLISVTPAPGGDAPFQAEFLVGDRNVEELLPEAARDLFLQGAAGLWGRGDLHVTNVTSALDRGGRVPLPIEGRREGLQLAHHSSILGDSRELRRMARSRDVPRPRSTLPMFNVRTGQRCDPLGNLRDPLGNLRDPLGNLRDPLGNLRDGARAPLLPQ